MRRSAPAFPGRYPAFSGRPPDFGRVPRPAAGDLLLPVEPRGRRSSLDEPTDPDPAAGLPRPVPLEPADFAPDLLLEGGLPPLGDLPPALDLPPDAGLPLALARLLSELGLPARPDAEVPPREDLPPPAAGLPRPVPLAGLAERLDDDLPPVGRPPELLRPELEPRPAPVRPDRPLRAPPSATSFSFSGRRRPACHLRHRHGVRPATLVPTGGAGLGRVVMAPEHCGVPDMRALQPPAQTPETLRATPYGMALSEKKSGGVLLSHPVPRAVPSALKGLASGFGMLPGVSPSL